MTRLEIAVVAAVGMLTFALRYSFFALPPGKEFPRWARLLLAYVPPAVLTAVIAPMIFTQNSPEMALHWRNAWLVGATATALVMWRFKRLLPAMLSGFVALHAWQWLA